MSLLWTLNLPHEDKAACALLKAYEESRKQVQQGYVNFQEFTPDSLTTPKFKTARTVAKWWEKAWKASRKEVNLRGYITFVFANSPVLPQIGQLKNPMLLGKFIAAAPPRITLREQPTLERYRAVLCQEFKSTAAMAALGLLSKHDSV